MIDEFIRSVEATLFASATPLTSAEIGLHVGEGDVEGALASLAEHYAGRGIDLVEGGRYFQTLPPLPPRRAPRLSRAAPDAGDHRYHDRSAAPRSGDAVQISKGMC